MPLLTINFVPLQKYTLKYNRYFSRTILQHKQLTDYTSSHQRCALLTCGLYNGTEHLMFHRVVVSGLSHRGVTYLTEIKLIAHPYHITAVQHAFCFHLVTYSSKYSNFYKTYQMYDILIKSLKQISHMWFSSIFCFLPLLGFGHERTTVLNASLLGFLIEYRQVDFQLLFQPSYIFYAFCPQCIFSPPTAFSP